MGSWRDVIKECHSDDDTWIEKIFCDNRFDCDGMEHIFSEQLFDWEKYLRVLGHLVSHGAGLFFTHSMYTRFRVKKYREVVLITSEIRQNKHVCANSKMKHRNKFDFNCPRKL